MNDMKQINLLFTEVYNGLKDVIHSRSDLHNCRLFMQPPNNAYLPNAQLTDTSKLLSIENLSYQERKYKLEYLVEIYAEDISSTNKFIITKDIEEVVSEYMRIKGFKLIGSRPILNLDTNVRRIQMRFTALYDIDTKIIFKQ